MVLTCRVVERGGKKICEQLPHINVLSTCEQWEKHDKNVWGKHVARMCAKNLLELLECGGHTLVWKVLI